MQNDDNDTVFLSLLEYIILYIYFFFIFFLQKKFITHIYFPVKCKFWGMIMVSSWHRKASIVWKVYEKKCWWKKWNKRRKKKEKIHKERVKTIFFHVVPFLLWSKFYGKSSRFHKKEFSELYSEKGPPYYTTKCVTEKERWKK